MRLYGIQLSIFKSAAHIAIRLVGRKGLLCSRYAVPTTFRRSKVGDLRCILETSERVDSEGAVPFEARMNSTTELDEDVRWIAHDLRLSIFKQAALQTGNSEAGRLRLKALDGGLIVEDRADSDVAATNAHGWRILVQR